MVLINRKAYMVVKNTRHSCKLCALRKNCHSLIDDGTMLVTTCNNDSRLLDMHFENLEGILPEEVMKEITIDFLSIGTLLDVFKKSYCNEICDNSLCGKYECPLELYKKNLLNLVNENTQSSES